MTQLLTRTAQYLLERNNQFMLSAAEDSFATLCHAWFIVQAGEGAKEYQ